LIYYVKTSTIHIAAIGYFGAVPLVGCVAIIVEVSQLMVIYTMFYGQLMVIYPINPNHMTWVQQW
jgi:hypothetical protein